MGRREGTRLYQLYNRLYELEHSLYQGNAHQIWLIIRGRLINIPTRCSALKETPCIYFTRQLNSNNENDVYPIVKAPLYFLPFPPTSKSELENDMQTAVMMIEAMGQDGAPAGVRIERMRECNASNLLGCHVDWYTQLALNILRTYAPTLDPLEIDVIIDCIRRWTRLLTCKKMGISLDVVFHFLIYLDKSAERLIPGSDDTTIQTVSDTCIIGLNEDSAAIQAVVVSMICAAKVCHERLVYISDILGSLPAELSLDTARRWEKSLLQSLKYNVCCDMGDASHIFEAYGTDQNGNNPFTTVIGLLTPPSTDAPMSVEMVPTADEEGGERRTVDNGSTDLFKIWRVLVEFITAEGFGVLLRLDLEVLHSVVTLNPRIMGALLNSAYGCCYREKIQQFFALSEKGREVLEQNPVLLQCNLAIIDELLLHPVGQPNNKERFDALIGRFCPRTFFILMHSRSAEIPKKIMAIRPSCVDALRNLNDGLLLELMHSCPVTTIERFATLPSEVKAVICMLPTQTICELISQESSDVITWITALINHDATTRWLFRYGCLQSLTDVERLLELKRLSEHKQAIFEALPDNVRFELFCALRPGKIIELLTIKMTPPERLNFLLAHEASLGDNKMPQYYHIAPLLRYLAPRLYRAVTTMRILSKAAKSDIPNRVILMMLVCATLDLVYTFLRNIEALEYPSKIQNFLQYCAEYPVTQTALAAFRSFINLDTESLNRLCCFSRRFLYQVVIQANALQTAVFIAQQAKREREKIIDRLTRLFLRDNETIFTLLNKPPTEVCAICTLPSRMGGRDVAGLLRRQGMFVTAAPAQLPPQTQAPGVRL